MEVVVPVREVDGDQKHGEATVAATTELESIHSWDLVTSVDIGSSNPELKGSWPWTKAVGDLLLNLFEIEPLHFVLAKRWIVFISIF